MDMSLSKLQEIVKDSEACSPAVYGVSKSPSQLNHWATSYAEIKKKKVKVGTGLNCILFLNPVLVF